MINAGQVSTQEVQSQTSVSENQQTDVQQQTQEVDHLSSVGRPENLFSVDDDSESEQQQSTQSERPEWLPEKFKTAEDLSKSYHELEKKLGSFKGAPEAYELNLSEDLQPYAYEADNPFLKDFNQIMKENNVSQDLYQKISECHLNYLRSQNETSEQAKLHQYKTDLEALGESGLKEIKGAIKWASEVLPPEDYELLSEIGNYDISIGKLVKRFYDAYSQKSYIKIPDEASAHDSKEELAMQAKELMSDKRYGRDDLFTNKVDNLYKRLYG